MLIRLESDLERAVCNYAHRRGILHIKLNIQGRTGFPDRQFFIPGGKPLLIEFKRKGGRVRPMQAYVYGVLQKLEYDVRFIDNTTDGFRAIDGELQKAGL